MGDVHQTIAADESGPIIVPTGLNTKRRCQMGFACVATAKKNYIAMLFDIVASGQLPDNPKVEVGHGGKIKALQGLQQGKFRLSHPTVESVFRPGLQLGRCQFQ